MTYIFIVNGRKDKEFILPDLQRQMQECSLTAEVYQTKGVGDGTRYVRTYCEFHQDEKVCFVACGGSGTANEVASGIIGQKNKSLAILAYGTTNDLLKIYPSRDFRSLKDIVFSGEDVSIDAIRCNDDYSINVINIGFDAYVAYEANLFLESGVKAGYLFGLVKAAFTRRYNRLTIFADGKKITRWLTLLCAVANGKYTGGFFQCAPKAKVDDGLLDVCLWRGMSLLAFLIILPSFIKGTHLNFAFAKRKLIYRQVRHVEVYSKDLIYVSLDGEIFASDHFDINILDKAVTLRLPCLEKEGTR